MSYSSEVLADSPLGYWRLNATTGTTAADSSGNGRTLTLAGGSAGVDYTLNVAGALSGSGDSDTAWSKTSTAVAATYNLAAAAWMLPAAVTCETWVKFTGASTVFPFGRGSATPNYGLSCANRKPVWTVRTGTSTTTLTGPANIDSGTWRHVVGTYDGANMVLYVDGLPVATVAKTGTLSTTANDLQIGGTGSVAPPCSVDEAAIYGSALSAARVLAHYTAGTTIPTPVTPTVTSVTVTPQRSPLVPWLTSIDGSLRLPLFSIGPTGSWGDLAFQTRWGEGASGMFEASWTMPLPPDFTHPLLRRGTLLEMQDGPWRIGSPLILSEPAVGTGYSDPWQFTATGIGREVEGENSFACFDGSGNTTAVPSTAVDQARARGWRITDRHANVPTSAIGGASSTDELMTVGSLLNAVNDLFGTRWAVNGDNILQFYADPTTPTYQVTPGAVALGTADDDYATVVYLRYLDSVTLTYKTAFSPLSISNVETRFGRREFTVDMTDAAAIATATAQANADGILARLKGRLAWTNGMTVTSNQILTMGGVPADLSKVAEDVASGCMVRLHGIWNDLLEYNGQTWLDIIIGEARYVDGSQTLDLSPLGLAARDLASVVEQVTGYRAAA